MSFAILWTLSILLDMRGLSMVKPDYRKLTLEQVSDITGNMSLMTPSEIAEGANTTLALIDHLFGSISDMDGILSSDLYTSLSFLHALSRLDHELTVNGKGLNL